MMNYISLYNLITILIVKLLPKDLIILIVLMIKNKIQMNSTKV